MSDRTATVLAVVAVMLLLAGAAWAGAWWLDWTPE